MLVLARHSYKPDGNFIAKRIDALVEEFDHMTFGSVSSFLARRTAFNQYVQLLAGQADISGFRLPQADTPLVQ